MFVASIAMFCSSGVDNHSTATARTTVARTMPTTTAYPNSSWAAMCNSCEDGQTYCMVRTLNGVLSTCTRRALRILYTAHAPLYVVLVGRTSVLFR